ncbi:PepSY domain-containing protein [Acinetobacter sp. YH16032]|uniref:PepSY domain-containing protein n=1 Tax=Acinetobacter sp. YH16032 TaxID=2601181 RepID=UPI0015D2194D|nr:PepSY domain-containing protein [Acinetobacter sp. YH16032]
MFKKIFFQLHWFFGITAGLILALMGVTGAIYSYEQQIIKLINQESYTVVAEQRPKLTPAEIYQHFQQEHPDLKINSITIAAQPTDSSSINVAKEGERRGLTMMINPYSAELLPEIKGRKFFAFVQQLHRNLTVGPVGKQITGACTLILIFFVLSGLYLRWPKKHSFKQWFSVKPKLKGRNFIWDLHAVVGTWVAIFYLMLACTGLYWSYDWWRNGMFKVLGVERPQPQMQAGGPGSNAGPNAQREGREERKSLQTEQIHFALNQSWSTFNQQFKNQFSSVTFTIPKRANGELELSFVDPVPQHERARNKATVDLNTNQLKDVELYEDKKLNEKIMSSMLPVHRGSFFGPIYQFFAMLAALAMPLFFVTGWMLYLKRRKQKQLTREAKQNLAVVDVDPNVKPWLIAYASQTGVSEQLAWRTASILQAARQPVTVKSVQSLTTNELQTASQILVVASTYGTGEAPDLAASFEKKLMSHPLNLSHAQFAVMALGSREYPDTYCSFGHRIYDWFNASGATPLFNVIEVDNANNQDIQNWTDALAQAAQLELATLSIDKVFDQWKLQKRTLLNPNSLGQPAYNLELESDHDAIWQAGDIAEIQPGNSIERIQAFLQQHNLDEALVLATTGQTLVESLWNKNLNSEIQPFATAEELVEQLENLPTREYSIASIPTQGMMRLVVRQQRDEQQQLGLGSGWLTHHVAVGAQVQLRIRTNESFHLIDDNRPIICIGNGTGIAGLMSLISARVRLDYTDNWLIFGERQREHDFFYKETIEAWQNTAMLKRIDLAFSRDQPEKVYVHHILRQNADEVVKWIHQGAVIYVCGSINGMASDVDLALIEILGETTVDELRQAGRYRRDVY